MLVAFLESIKYAGHLFPIAFLRIFMGYYYLQEATEKYSSDYLTQPLLAETISESLRNQIPPLWLHSFLENVAIPYWQVFAHLLASVEFALGICLLIGYLVRPACLLAVLVSTFFIWISPPEQAFLHTTFIAINITLAWFGAGRCIGFDYYFYKRMRGIWW
tara:strand:+ start:1172 stop:1654 length:483 start_codon:yes stop_codon:yes gene_type:complete